MMEHGYDESHYMSEHYNRQTRFMPRSVFGAPTPIQFEDAMLMGVVKAGAYGHGADMVAHELEDMGFDWLAVATADEGIELRNSGIKTPILVLGYCDTCQYPELIEWDITPTIYTYDMAKSLDQIAKSAGKTVNIHIKIDSGMSRIGFLVEEKTVETIQAIHAMEYLNIQGIFTHFAKASAASSRPEPALLALSSVPTPLSRL